MEKTCNAYVCNAGSAEEFIQRWLAFTLSHDYTWSVPIRGGTTSCTRAGRRCCCRPLSLVRKNGGNGWQRRYPNSTAGPQLSKAMVQQFIGALVGLPKLKTNVTGKEPLSPSWFLVLHKLKWLDHTLNLSLSCVCSRLAAPAMSENQYGSCWFSMKRLSNAFQHCTAVFFWQEAKVGASGGCSWCHCSASATCQIW